MKPMPGRLGPLRTAMHAHRGLKRVLLHFGIIALFQHALRGQVSVPDQTATRAEAVFSALPDPYAMPIDLPNTGDEADVSENSNVLLTLRHPHGLGCLFDMGSAENGQWKLAINNSLSQEECANQHGTSVPGDIHKENVGIFLKTGGDPIFQVITNYEGNVYYSTFAGGARTDEDGTCLDRCQGASTSHASTAWLNSMILNGSLDGLMSFAAKRTDPRSGGFPMELLAGPGFSPVAPDHWAGPGGMGTPRGRGDWAAMVHDYNFTTNEMTMQNTGYFSSPFISRATAKALIQSNNNLIENAGGAQAVKIGLFFGLVNAYQWFFHPFF